MHIIRSAAVVVFATWSMVGLRSRKRRAELALCVERCVQKEIHMTAGYPVHYSIQFPPRFTRLQLAMRVAAFFALGMVGLSFGTVFMFAFLGLPVLAATRISRRDSAVYVSDDGPRIVGALRWFAAASAWAGLVAEELPGRSADETVRLDVETGTRSTPRSAIWRVITGIPSALVLAVLCGIGLFVWMWAALSILLFQRVGPGAFRYLVGVQRWSIRLLAYQASLVDEYPPFSFSESLPSNFAASRVEA